MSDETRPVFMIRIEAKVDGDDDVAIETENAKDALDGELCRMREAGLIYDFTIEVAA